MLKLEDLQGLIVRVVRVREYSQQMGYQASKGMPKWRRNNSEEAVMYNNVQ